MRKSAIVKVDPWITAAEIAVASLRSRTSKNINEGKSMLLSGNFSPLSITELSSSIGTIELENGTVKKSRHFFEQSLISPNDNSLAQAEWALRKENKLNLIIPENLIGTSYEAAAYEAYYISDWKNVIENCTKWFIDTPHSKTPLLVAHHVASVFLKDYELALNYARQDSLVIRIMQCC